MCDVSRGGTPVHCASGLIVCIKESIIKTFPHAHAIKQRETGGAATALMDNQPHPPHPRTPHKHTHRHTLSWDDILYINAESTIDGSCLSNADGVTSTCVAVRLDSSWSFDGRMNQLGLGGTGRNWFSPLNIQHPTNTTGCCLVFELTLFLKSLINHQTKSLWFLSQDCNPSWGDSIFLYVSTVLNGWVQFYLCGSGVYMSRASAQRTFPFCSVRCCRGGLWGTAARSGHVNPNLCLEGDQLVSSCASKAMGELPDQPEPEKLMLERQGIKPLFTCQWKDNKKTTEREYTSVQLETDYWAVMIFGHWEVKSKYDRGFN